MTLFSSGRHLTRIDHRDVKVTGRDCICPANRSGWVRRYKAGCRWHNPRRHPLTNPANPILDHYRKRESTWPIDGYLRSLIPANSWQWESIATADQMKHALNVLSRLAILRTTP